MKNAPTPAWVIFTVIGIWAVILFWTFVTGLKHSFKFTPPPPRPEAAKMLREQRQKNADTMQQQKLLMEQRQQRFRDMQKK